MLNYFCLLSAKIACFVNSPDRGVMYKNNRIRDAGIHDSPWTMSIMVTIACLSLIYRIEAVVLLVLTNRTPADVEALKTMTAGFRASDARVIMFDDVEDSHTDETSPQQTALISKNAG